MRSQFHGVGSDLSEDVSTVRAASQLVTDFDSKWDWRHLGTAWDKDTGASVGGHDSISTSAEGRFADKLHHRDHANPHAASLDMSATSDTSTPQDLQIQSKTIVQAAATDTASAASTYAASTAMAVDAVAASATTSTSAATASAAAAATTYPSATNTGVAPGSALKVYTGTYYVSDDNAVVSNIEVHGSIVIDAKNVTMSNIKLVSTTPWHALRVMDGATGFTLSDSEIDGQGSTVNAIYGFGTFLRNNLHDSDNGINVVGPSVINGNYIHGFRGGEDSHYDGIEINGGDGHDISIVKNTIVNDHDQTSAVMMNNEFGSLSNITIDNNILEGGGYTVYLDGRKGGGSVDDASIKITNNQIGGGYWGDFALYDDKPVVSGNVDLGIAPVVTNPSPGTGAVVYTGTAGNDTLPLSGKTNTGNETYNGLDGNDILLGGAGADVLNGGRGWDTASYAGSNAAVNVNLQTGAASGGHAAGDTFNSIENLIGSSYADTLTGHSGENRLDGGAGADKLAGGTGNDSYIVDNTGDVVIEASGAGTDLVSSSVTYTLAANVENITLVGSANLNATGNSGANVITGNNGNNVLTGGAGADKLSGGVGWDTASYAGSNAAVNINLQTGAASGGHAAGDTFNSIENLIGSSYADTLTGHSGDNKLDGGAGADKLAGSTGNDTYVVDNTGDVVTEASGAGTDQVNASVTYTLTANVENLLLLGSGNLNATGNSGANTITGNAGANSINGGSGDDRIEGGNGQDTLTGAGGADQFLFRQAAVATSGADHITDFASNDTIVFDVTSGSTGALSASAFRLGTAAVDSDDRFIFDQAHHSLYYDSDGKGSAAKVLVAVIDDGYTLHANDILLA